MMSANYCVSPIEAFNDNYFWAITHQKSSDCVIVDPGSAKEVLTFLADNHLTLAAILITHHHQDHIGGVVQLKQQFPHIEVYGPSKEAQQVVTVPLKENDTVEIQSLNLTLNVLDVPGHTLGHIAYVDDHSLFCGDTLFAAGCGRMFEGTPELFSASLAKLSALPEHTNIYCAHEYTLSNLKFAKAVEPNSMALDNRVARCQEQRSNNQPTLPSTIKEELETNPFFRLTEPAVIASLSAEYGLSIKEHVADNFSFLRQWKDNF